ncbi:MAG: hypothetical protein V4574_15265 [Pseudomonadota bacterium]
MLKAAALVLAALLPAAASAQDAAPPPVRSVMIVETTSDVKDMGEYIPPDAGPDYMPWHSIVDMRVRLRRHLSGPRYPGRMKLILHALYISGVRLLVIAEPRKDGKPGFFVLWKTPGGEHGRFCVPEDTIAELGVEAAFAGVATTEAYGVRQRCIRA